MRGQGNEEYSCDPINQISLSRIVPTIFLWEMSKTSSSQLTWEPKLTYISLAIVTLGLFPSLSIRWSGPANVLCYLHPCCPMLLMTTLWQWAMEWMWRLKLRLESGRYQFSYISHLFCYIPVYHFKRWLCCYRICLTSCHHLSQSSTMGRVWACLYTLELKCWRVWEM